MVPVDRPSFAQYCLSRLGAPVIPIQVSDNQVDDRIDDALKFYQDYHADGQFRTFYKYQVTQTDINNKYITVPNFILDVVSVFPIGQNLATNNLFNIRYQIALNDLYDLTATTMVPYYMAMQNIQFLEELLVGHQPIRFNRHTHLLYVDMDWTYFNPGDYMVFEVYQLIDPTQYPDVWGDRWLQRYATALIKRQWGMNLTLFKNVTLAGGVQFNAEKIYNDAEAEIQKLEDEVIEKYSLPPRMEIG